MVELVKLPNGEMYLKSRKRKNLYFLVKKNMNFNVTFPDNMLGKRILIKIIDFDKNDYNFEEINKRLEEIKEDIKEIKYKIQTKDNENIK